MTPAPVVAHSLHTYLFRTGSWIYSQLVHTPGFRHVVVATRTQNLEVFPWQPVCALSDRAGLSRWLQRELARRTGLHYPCFVRWLRRHEARLLQSHFGNRGYLDLRLKDRLGLPHVTTFYGHDASLLARDPRWQRRYPDLFAGCDRFLAEGTHMARTLAKLGCPEAKIRVQHLGVDLSLIPYLPRRPVDGRGARLLCAATFRDKKGITYCLEAFANVCAKYPDAHLTIVGDAGRSAREQRYKAEVLRVIADRRLEGRVTLAGFLDYPAFLESARDHDLFLSHSVVGSDGETEGGAPVTLIEMSAAGMPVVSSLHCDIPEVIRDGETGLLVAERDVDALTDRLDWLLADPARWEPLGRAGRAHVEREYNAQVQGERLAAIYHELL